MIAFLSVFHIEYKEYNRGAVYLSYFLTPATVCLAIPLYKQLELCQHLIAVVSCNRGRGSGKCRQYLCDVPFLSAGAYALCDIASKVHYDGDWHGRQEAGGVVVTLTVISIIITGILGNIIADWLFQIFKIEEPIAKGLALGTAVHAIGTAKALELGEIVGAMSSLSIAVAGLFDRSGSTTDVGTDLKVVLKR